jgi:exopolysaccharide biosynthesis polyprenyl glycosylphosphotransferase
MLASPRVGALDRRGLRTAGQFVIAFIFWLAAAGYGWSGAGAALVLAGLSTALLAYAAHGAGEYLGATSVRVARYLLAGAALFVGAQGLLAVAVTQPPVARSAAAALVISAYAAIWDLVVCRPLAHRRPLRLLVVGAGEPAARLDGTIASERRGTIDVIGFVSTDDEVPLAVPVLGTLDELCAVVEQTKPDALVLAAPTGRLDVLNRILELSELPAVLELSSAYELAVGRVPISEINAAWFLRALELSRRTALVAPKRAFDIVVSSALLILSAPFLALVALAIRLDSPGPVLYRQVRVGERGRLFTMLKFRSMFVDAEIDGARWAEKDDPRVTRVGRVLRRFRIDEVPQVWNVLRGEMTLVGPRPERPELVEKLVDDVPFYESRHLVRPGVTGWAQVYAPYGASAEDACWKLSYDLYYLKNSSIAMDLGIMLRTAAVMAGGRGAR